MLNVVFDPLGVDNLLRLTSDLELVVVPRLMVRVGVGVVFVGFGVDGPDADGFDGVIGELFLES